MRSTRCCASTPPRNWRNGRRSRRRAPGATPYTIWNWRRAPRTDCAGSEQEQWLARLEQEHDNLRAALGWAEREQTDLAVGLRLGAALSRFWYVRGYYSEGRAALAEVLAWPGGNAAHLWALRARALQAAGDLARAQGDYPAARVLSDESLALYRAQGRRKRSRSR